MSLSHIFQDTILFRTSVRDALMVCAATIDIYIILPQADLFC
jgi:hypothetical protein